MTTLIISSRSKHEHVLIDVNPTNYMLSGDRQRLLRLRCFVCSRVNGSIFGSIWLRHVVTSYMCVRYSMIASLMSLPLLLFSFFSWISRFSFVPSNTARLWVEIVKNATFWYHWSRELTHNRENCVTWALISMLSIQKICRSSSICSRGAENNATTTKNGSRIGDKLKRDTMIESEKRIELFA